MSELRPHPFGALVRRMLTEARAESKIFDLPLSKAFFGAAPPERSSTLLSLSSPAASSGETPLDLSVAFHGQRAGTPLGPAAGPQSQMAQNLVLSWLCGCRVMELKTVQVLDQLEIPRPCIDMATVGFNVEWSQELRLQQSLEEYVKGSMLIEILRASGELPAAVSAGAALGDPVFDMSVGYDLKGIQSESVTSFLRGMQDAGEVVQRFKDELLSAELQDVLEGYPQLAEIEFRTALSKTLTLSTFHGCPPDEIESISSYLLETCGLDVIVKLNPTLLGPDLVRELLEEQMGYADLHVPPQAFTDDMQWEQMVAIVGRLGDLADRLGRSFGVKFTNTLIVSNHRDFFPAAERQMYLSGPPLHVLAMNLVMCFRAVFGARFPISFSAGIDRGNFADAVALGLVPVTVCSDLLKPGGYARAPKYLDALEVEMHRVGAACVGDYVIRALGHGAASLRNVATDDPARAASCLAALEDGRDLRAVAGAELHTAWVKAAALLNTTDYVPRATLDPRYCAGSNSRPPRKIGATLDLFDCTTCDKCVPVCPNDANFSFELPRAEVPVQKLRLEGGRFLVEDAGTWVIGKAKQYANYADFCNECGNCDVFCPEDGGPYVIKPRFFGSHEDWVAFADQNGFVLVQTEGARTIFGRIAGLEFALEEPVAGGSSQVRYRGPGFEVMLDPSAPEATVTGRCDPGREADLTYMHILRAVRDAVYGAVSGTAYGTVRANYLNMATARGAVGGRR